MGVVSLSAQQLPDVKIENAQGKIVSMRSIAKGKPMIISYWSITCKPCIQELNAINDALEEWREEADFEVVAISTDDARMKASAKTIASSRGWDFICLYDDKQTLKRAMNVSLTPQSFVVDANGKIVFSHSGYTPGSEQLLFDKILELKPQHNYVYRVMVESDYISVVLDVYDSTANDWQSGADISSSIGTLTETLEIGKWTLEGWQPAGNIDYTIG